MKTLLLLSLLTFTFFTNARTERKKAEHNIIAGLNIGATTPLSLPDNIRAIDYWYPAFSPSLGYEFVYHLPHSWSIGTALKLDYKGMTVKDQVMYMHTRITVEDGSSTGTFEGYFTGTNETNVRNAYVTLPVYAIYDFNGKWRIKAGGYVAWLFSSSFKGSVSDGYMRKGSSLGEKIEVDYATFDLSNQQSQWDWGVNLAGERLVGKKLAVMANFMWGLKPLFSPSTSSMDFNMYNMYLTLGVTYRII